MPTTVIMGNADYDFLRQTADLLQPGVYARREHKGLHRTLRLERVVPGDQALMLISYNGYDRRELEVRMAISDLRKDLGGTFNAAVAEALTLKGVPRVYFVQSIADGVLAELGLANSEARRDGGVEYTTWIDHITDNVLIKGYRRAPSRAAMGFAITRSMAESSDDKVAEFVRKTASEMAEIFRDEARLAEHGAFIAEGESMRIFYGAAI